MGSNLTKKSKSLKLSKKYKYVFLPSLNFLNLRPCLCVNSKFLCLVRRNKKNQGGWGEKKKKKKKKTVHNLHFKSNTKFIPNSFFICITFTFIKDLLKAI
jgi:hypothetical protein